jgi:xanthine dehydrogenase accessory factor
MLVLMDGSLVGSVGGGALEGACQSKAQELFRTGDSFAELNFQLNAAAAAEAGMVCGGAVTVLLQRVEPRLVDMFRLMRDEYTRGLRPMLLTFLPKNDKPPKILFLSATADDEVPQDLRQEILRKSRRAPFLVAVENDEIFVEPLVHPGTVYLAGAGHVALAVAQLAVFAGFEVAVMDDRAEFASTERYPQAREVRVVENFTDCFTRLGLDDYVIIVTRGHLHDRDVLTQALRTDAGYVGMIGSRSKRQAVYAALRSEGFTDTDLDRVHCPIGLSIGADTPAEIAVSIVAELIQARAAMKG